MPFRFEPEKLVEDPEKFAETNDAAGDDIAGLSENKIAYKTTTAKNPVVDWHLYLMRQALRALHVADFDIRSLGDEILRRDGFVTHGEIYQLLLPAKITPKERTLNTDEIVSALRAVHEDQLDRFKGVKPAEYSGFLNCVYARIGSILQSSVAKDSERDQLDRNIKDNFPLFLYSLGFRIPTGVPKELWSKKQNKTQIEETNNIRTEFLAGISAGKGPFSDERITAAIKAIQAEIKRKEEAKRVKK